MIILFLHKYMYNANAMCAFKGDMKTQINIKAAQSILLLLTPCQPCFVH